MSDVFAGLQARFVARCADDLVRFRQLIATGDLECDEARALAHSLAGAGATFGFPLISTAAGRLDDAYVERRRPSDTDANALVVALDQIVTAAS